MESKGRTINEEKEKLSSENEIIVAENKRLQAQVTPISQDTFSVHVENTFHSLYNRMKVIEIDEMHTEYFNPSRNNVLIISDSHGIASL